MTWTEGEVLLDWLRSSPGRLVLLLPVFRAGATQHRRGWCCSSVVPASLPDLDLPSCSLQGSPLYVAPVLSSVSGFGCWVSHLPQGPFPWHTSGTVPGAAPLAQPCLSPTPTPAPTPLSPCPRAGFAQDAVHHWTSGPRSFYFPLPLASPHKAGGVKAGTVALLLGQDCIFKPVGMGHMQPESCWVRRRTFVLEWERFGSVAGSGWSSHWNLWAEIWPCHRDTSLVCSQEASLSLVNVF